MNTEVRIKNPKHPHYGELAKIVLNKNGNVDVRGYTGREQFMVLLKDCPHGVDKCYVAVDDVQYNPNRKGR